MQRFRRFFKLVRDMFRLMVGQPNYQTYLAHHHKHHDDMQPLSEIEFYRNRQNQRYGEGRGKMSSCC